MTAANEPTCQEMLAEIEEIYARVGGDEDILPGELRWTRNWRGSPLQMMSLAARGLYSEMLTQAWASRARLVSTGEEEIMRLVRAMPDEWAVAWPKVRHYWVAATDPRTQAEILVNRKQLEVYVGALRNREITLARNRKAARASVEARRRAKTPPLAAEAPPLRKPAPAPAPPPPSTAAPNAGPRDVPGCPECGGELNRKQRSTSPGGQRWPPAWYCKAQNLSISLNDPRVYAGLTDAAKASVDHDLSEYERATATAAEPQASPRAPRAPRPTPPSGPSVLERGRPF